jgi:hypothetical protein
VRLKPPGHGRGLAGERPAVQGAPGQQPRRPPPSHEGLSRHPRQEVDAPAIALLPDGNFTVDLVDAEDAQRLRFLPVPTGHVEDPEGLLAQSEETVARLVPSIRDPEGPVRNNVLRVLTATQQRADRPLVELATVVDALSMPETSDRNKSLYLLKMLLEDLKPEALQAQRAPLIRQLGSQLVDMASLQHPIIREPATEVLELLSGERHESPGQWKAWLARQRS